MMNEPIIGLDFGNYNSFPCFISNFDLGTRMGGTVRDLLPSELPDGIPSVYFYSQKAGELFGENAVRTKASPRENRQRYLKRRLDQTVTLDGKCISYDEAITGLIQHILRSANAKLRAGWQITTNLVSLAYPASYTPAKRQRLIELVEKATLEDGRHIKVFGTIAEPAAAALDYLAEFAKSDRDTTVLTFDLGGGTFDLGLVSAYPKGRKNDSGQTYYYDIINTRGIDHLGGAEFDEIMYECLASKLETTLNKRDKERLKEEAEKIKKELSTDTDAVLEFECNGEYEELSVTRAEFENACRPLLMKTIEKTRELLKDHPNQMPELILLTGGACQMPMVKEAIEREFPNYKGKIETYRPSKAIAYGAARFGATEHHAESKKEPASIVQQRVMYDIGVRFYDNEADDIGHITRYITAGTVFPCSSEYRASGTVDVQAASTFEVYEAVKQHPDKDNVFEDYQQIMDVTIYYDNKVPVGTPSETRLVIDKRGLLTIEAKDLSKDSKPVVRNHVELKNLN